MVLEQGNKVHIMVRRQFEKDLRRHFVGEVLEVTGLLARVEGYAFVLETPSNQYVRRPDKRVRIIGLADSGNIIIVLPPEANLEQVKYVRSKDNHLTVTDGKSFALDINEFGANQ